MENAQIIYIHDDEVRGFHINLGNAEVESNGHGEGNLEIINLVDTIKSLQRDVLRYEVDNERLMESQE
jgi:hypothetical protein